MTSQCMFDVIYMHIYNHENACITTYRHWHVEQMHIQLTCIHDKCIPMTTSSPSTFQHNSNNDYHHAYITSTYTSFKHTWKTHYSHEGQALNHAMIHSMVSYITQREHKPNTTQREWNPLRYHSITPSSHTYPILPVHHSKYVMKSYYDMIQPPISP